ncbi:hypothetical protein [Streptomyces sp. MJM1172]|uniref:hypothetical protein n=1 Tax=Streptomyces sp. MJM1172 TaxID=1703926 RepID=UPI00093E453F|nr:hypothetical protein [Streptomyces sp. MJM1172]OKI62563.1 hypothetical protein AMK15_16245 [Streptomyces sp. MJM1172]
MAAYALYPSWETPWLHTRLAATVGAEADRGAGAEALVPLLRRSTARNAAPWPHRRTHGDH